MKQSDLTFSSNISIIPFHLHKTIGICELWGYNIYQEMSSVKTDACCSIIYIAFVFFVQNKIRQSFVLYTVMSKTV